MTSHNPPNSPFCKGEQRDIKKLLQVLRGLRTPESVKKMFFCVTLNEVKGLNSLK